MSNYPRNTFSVVWKCIYRNYRFFSVYFEYHECIAKVLRVCLFCAFSWKLCQLELTLGLHFNLIDLISIGSLHTLDKFGENIWRWKDGLFKLWIRFCISEVWCLMCSTSRWTKLLIYPFERDNDNRVGYLTLNVM